MGGVLVFSLKLTSKAASKLMVKKDDPLNFWGPPYFQMGFAVSFREGFGLQQKLLRLGIVFFVVSSAGESDRSVLCWRACSQTYASEWHRFSWMIPDYIWKKFHQIMYSTCLGFRVAYGIPYAIHAWVACCFQPMHLTWWWVDTPCEIQWCCTYPIGSMGLVYLPTFIIKINHSCR